MPSQQLQPENTTSQRRKFNGIIYREGNSLCRSNVDAHVLSKYFASGGHDSLGGPQCDESALCRVHRCYFYDEKKPAPAHMGILGPVIRAQVGERIRVVFKNKARFPFSMHPHGVFIPKMPREQNITMEPMGQTRTTILSHPMIHLLTYGMCRKMLDQGQMI